MSWEDAGPDTVDFAKDMWPHWWRVVTSILLFWKLDWLHSGSNVFVEMCGWPLNDLTSQQRVRIQDIVNEGRNVGEASHRRGYVVLNHNPGYYFGHVLYIGMLIGVVVVLVLTFT